MSEITIPNNIYYRILTEAGFPIITVTDLSLTEDQVKDYFIYPAMQEYFRWFPLVLEEQHTIGASTFSYDFPRTTTFGITDARIVTSRFTGVVPTDNPLINAENIAVGSGMYSGSYGTRYNYGFQETRITKDMERQSVIDYRKAFRIRVNPNNRTLTGYSNITGKLSISWADYSDDWTDIAFTREEEVIKLASSNLLSYLGMLRNQDTSDLPTSLNGDDFTSRADKLKEDITGRWREFTKIVIIRG